MTRICVVLIFVLGMIIFACDSNDNSTDDDQDDDSANDDQATDDDSTADDDDTLWLPEYVDDGSRFGVYSGDHVRVLEGAGWEKIEHKLYYDACYAISLGLYVLWAHSYGVCDLIKNGELVSLNFDYNEFDTGELLPDPFIFFDENLGFVSHYKYDNGVWSDFGYDSYDPRAPDDFVVVTENGRCLAYYNGQNLNQIACNDTHPINDGLTDNLFIFDVPKYVQPDDIWVQLKRSFNDPIYFSHWNGLEWDQIMVALDDMVGSGEDEYWWHIEWDFSSSDHGWALIEIEDYLYHYIYSKLWRYENGDWFLYDPGQPFTKPGSCVSDYCYRLSVVSDNEAWLICAHNVFDNPNYLLNELLYFAQIIDGETCFWTARYQGHMDTPSDISIKLIPAAEQNGGR